MEVVDHPRAAALAAPTDSHAYLADATRALHDFAALRIDRKTVHKLLASGALPPVRLGRVVRIPAAVLQSLCKSA